MTTTTHSQPGALQSGMQSLIRPAWTPATIAMMIGGFIIWPPLGLAMIAYILWGDRLEAFKVEANRATDSFMGQFRSGNMMKRAGGLHGASFGRSGNVAFDDWREEEMKRLEEKRAELARMESEFADYQRELRRGQGPQGVRAVPARPRRQGRRRRLIAHHSRYWAGLSGSAPSVFRALAGLMGGLDQVPAIAPRVAPHRDRAVGFRPRHLFEGHARGDHPRMVAGEIVGMQEQADPAAPPGCRCSRAAAPRRRARAAGRRPIPRPAKARRRPQRLPPPRSVSSMTVNPTAST